jgi:hypothetical protein
MGDENDESESAIFAARAWDGLTVCGGSGGQHHPPTVKFPKTHPKNSIKKRANFLETSAVFQNAGGCGGG